MKIAPPPASEFRRLQTLRDYAILDTPPEAPFDDLTRLASSICQTPIALMSLIDEDRQWFKSRLGLDAEQTPRELAFCSHAIHDRQVMVVSDASCDERFSDNPFVTGDPKIRFYAGAPLIAPDGEVMGTLCAIDRRPKRLRSDQIEALEALARQAMGQMELRRSVVRLQEIGRDLLEATQHAEEASRAKSRFLAHMSHELRTPLNAIIGFSSLLLKNPAAFDAEQTKDFLRRVDANGRHLLELIDSLLDLSRIEAGKMELSPERFAVTPWIEELVARIEPLAQARHNGVAIELAMGEDDTIECDPTKLAQCLLNLLSNACKFTEHGQIRVKVARDADRLVIRVVDTGRGMSEPQQALLFQEFERADDVRSIQGSGLGLVITRRLVCLMGGEIGVESEAGRGTTFEIRIPTAVVDPTSVG